MEDLSFRVVNALPGITVLLLLLSIVAIRQSLAQKLLIDNDSYKQWEELRHYNISNDGKYIWYSYESPAGGSTLVLSSSKGTSKRVFPGGKDAVFMSDSKHLIFKIATGVGIFDIQRMTLVYIKGGSNFKIPEENPRWILCTMTDHLLLKNSVDGREIVCPNADYGIFNSRGTVVWIVKEKALDYIDLLTLKQKSVYKSDYIQQCSLSPRGNEIAFLSGKEGGFSLMSYDLKSDTVRVLSGPVSKGMTYGYTLANEPINFSKDGRYLFYKYEKIQNSSRQDADWITPKVWVWHYLDKYMQTDYSNGNEYGQSLKPFTACILADGGEAIALEDSTRKLNGVPGNKYVITVSLANATEVFADTSSAPIYQLISLAGGSAKIFMPHSSKTASVQLSPAERFVTWKDTSSHRIYCYDIESGHIRNLTPERMPYDSTGLSERSISWYPNVIGWTSNDESLLINDRYDIWQVDAKGRRPAINLTGYYGIQHKVAFRLAESLDNLRKSKKGDRLLVAALVDSNRYNGFYSIRLSTAAKPQKVLNPGPFVYYFPGIFVHDPSIPIKAKNENVYLLQRQSDRQSSNLFLLSLNGKSRLLSEISPEQKYNWLTAELHHWKTTDGQTRYGILYKPANFDPRKKYPVIFHFYELRSNECYKYRQPGLSLGVLNIPWYVSNGYFVFIPDIWQQTGHTGRSALESVESAAGYLVRNYPWVDGKRMGLQGHSFGGFEVNYIVANSNMFAAAQASAGISNLTRYYGDIAFAGRNITGMMETGIFNMGWSPADRPDLYVENSPFFAANKVSTPLLLAHGMADDAVPWQNSLDFFIALRRLGKPVWLLTYEDEGHLIGSPECSRDFTIRQQQFFNHYLKDSLPPVWMVEGLPSMQRNVKSNLGSYLKAPK
jgi:dipeptidyl aminopeptidase/acylaminoacyl peptidase